MIRLSMLKKSICIAILYVPSVLYAQFTNPFPAVQPEMAWKGDDVVLSDSKSFKILKHDKTGDITIPVPPNTVDNRFAQNYFWVVQEDLESQRLRICRSEDGHDWEYLASWPFVKDASGKLDPQRRQRFYAHPLTESTLLLVIRNGDWFKINDKPYPIVVAKINDNKRLDIIHGVDLGLGERLGWYNGDKFVFNKKFNWLVSAQMNRPFLTVEDRVFLAFRRIGTFIEVRPNGSLGKTFRVIPNLDQKTAADTHAYDWAVLCAQPMKTGEILVLARTPDAVLEGRKRFPRKYTQADLGDEAAARTNQDALMAYPSMDWWNLDPAEGKIHRASSPVNVPAKFNSIEEFRNFTFYIDTKGNLLFPLLHRGSSCQ